MLQQWNVSGVKFAASAENLEDTYYSALQKLLACIKSMGEDKLILLEGGSYLGCWLESTGTINDELLSRLNPSVSETTFLIRCHYCKPSYVKLVLHIKKADAV
ncbi:hypothetical protein J45TS6_17560 [Paenibacillus sp. J45TS6]|uniref:hypothetical protein n=1 Tax=unclassified Paenibacillus TaxID=185978 RepID=UPI001B264FEA|nr:hypothetical protein [Paenibacillus sp. J45TS6]GIP43297.1 hypothetical protein J45TS6_17560 [Paenibacillus sp. J45TS6]